MNCRLSPYGQAWITACAAALLALPAYTYAQHPLFNRSRGQPCDPPPCLPPAPAEAPPTAPPTVPPEQPSEIPFGAEMASAIGGPGFTLGEGGYIDSALLRNQIRLRYDTAYGNNRPDRAEFFYAKCGALGGGAKGPPLIERNIDFQDISAYVEGLATPWLSGFIEVPVRFLNPEENANTAGFSDMNAGFRVALLNNQCCAYTFQFRVYIPTGDSERGLGTNHVSLEPALLVNQQLGERWTFLGELRDWIPVGGSNFQGNVLRYGAGLSYLAYNAPRFRIIPIAEFVGWTCLDGKVTNPDSLDLIETAGGDTIVNAKVGARFGFGQIDPNRQFSRSDLYIGYGRALTGDVWYKDMLRLEYRLRF